MKKFSSELASSLFEDLSILPDFVSMGTLSECQTLPKFLLKWKPNYGTGSRGWPRKNWKTYVQEDTTNFTGVNNIDNNTVKALASDRVQWRSMIRRQRDVCDAGHLND